MFPWHQRLRWWNVSSTFSLQRPVNSDREAPPTKEEDQPKRCNWAPVAVSSEMQAYTKPVTSFKAGTKKATFVPQKWTRPRLSRAVGKICQKNLFCWFIGSLAPQTCSMFLKSWGLDTKAVRQSGFHSLSRYWSIVGSNNCNTSDLGAISASKSTMKFTSSSMMFHSAFSRLPVFEKESGPFFLQTNLTSGKPSTWNSMILEPPGATSWR
mmetsp:Transcript_117137/g.376572  ORF Transcript_117137/g.376572 Transcript_117137/m.376572 type:complete len:210 (+) Transcript_117137:791-1420(+)